MQGFLHDVRYSARLLRRYPRHALLTIATLALGLGAATLLFTVAYAVLLQPFPWPNAGRVVVLTETRGGRAPRFGTFTNEAFQAWRTEPAAIEQIAAWSLRTMTLTDAGDPERIRATAATASLFPALGARPLIGAFFEGSDETAPVAVLSERLWRQRFDASPSAVGRAIHLDGQSYTIVAVLGDRAMYPDGQTQVIVPFRVPPAAGDLTLFNAIALLRPGASPDQAAAEGTARGKLVAGSPMVTTAIFGGTGRVEVHARSLYDASTGDVQRPLVVLLVAVGLLLATATANAAGLQLVRATARAREMTIRAALGAGSGRIIRQLLMESALLGLAGGLAGLAFTRLALRTLPSLMPADFPRLDGLGVGAPVLWFALVVSVGTSVVCALLPAVSLRRASLTGTLADDGTAPVGAGLRSRAARSRVLIMCGQVAIACVLLIGAALLGRSFLALVNADRGYDLDHVLSARLAMPSALYPSPERRFAIVHQVLSRLSDQPETIAAFTSELPLTPGGSAAALTIRSKTGASIVAQASPRIVSPGYFAALRIPAIAGRTFSEADVESSTPVVVVNRTFASRYLDQPAIGAMMPMAGYMTGSGPLVEVTVIGVVDDVRYVNAATTSQPEMYYSYRQLGGRLPVQTVTLLARTSGPAALPARAVAAAVREADPRLVADLILPLEQRLLTTLARPRMYAALLGGLAAFALLIAAVGLFGLLSYSVSLRTRALAIRSALGARRTDLLKTVLLQGLAVTVTGAAAGLLISAWLTRALSTQLYGVTTHDPVTFIAVPLLLVIVGSVACFLPGIRAARIDPVRVLRG
jgi:putative ABC transport system permease protein